MVSKRAADSPQEAGEALDATLPQDVPAGTAVDASDKPTLSKMWDAWTSRPENNAAMINFGLQLMQPRAMGQTGLGHFAQAIGAGGEAATRNVAAQEAEDKAERELDIKERLASVREEEGAAYAEGQRNKNKADKTSLNEYVARQRRWLNWQASKDPGMNLVDNTHFDPTVERIRAMDPRWKNYSKAQILADPAAAAIAEKMFRGGGDIPSPGVSGATPPPSGTPTLQQFLARARQANPNATDEQLTAYYNKTYGGR